VSGIWTGNTGTWKSRRKKLEDEIKSLAKKGDRASATARAKNLVQLRKQKTRLLSSKSQIKGIGFQATAMQSQVAVAGAMKTAGTAMKSMNAQINLPELQKTMQEFQMQNEKMEMSQEMMDDAMDSMFDDEDEDETDAVVDSVLTELGLETAGALNQHNVANTALTVPDPVADPAQDDDILARLQALSS